MRILSQKKFKPCTCELCGTVFQVEDGDKINGVYRVYWDDTISDVTLYGICPVCNYDKTPLAEE